MSVVPANQASWDDLQAVFGCRAAAKCQGQRIKLGDDDWLAIPVAEPAHRLREETDCGTRRWTGPAACSPSWTASPLVGRGRAAGALPATARG